MGRLGGASYPLCITFKAFYAGTSLGPSLIPFVKFDEEPVLVAQWYPFFPFLGFTVPLQSNYPNPKKGCPRFDMVFGLPSPSSKLRVFEGCQGVRVCGLADSFRISGASGLSRV